MSLQSNALLANLLTSRAYYCVFLMAVDARATDFYKDTKYSSFLLAAPFYWHIMSRLPLWKKKVRFLSWDRQQLGCTHNPVNQSRECCFWGKGYYINALHTFVPTGLFILPNGLHWNLHLPESREILCKVVNKIGITGSLGSNTFHILTWWTKMDGLYHWVVGDT